jgi:hypothetical protein
VGETIILLLAGMNPYGSGNRKEGGVWGVEGERDRRYSPSTAFVKTKHEGRERESNQPQRTGIGWLVLRLQDLRHRLDILRMQMGWN